MLFDDQNYYLFLDFLFLKGIFRFPICKIFSQFVKKRQFCGKNQR